MEFNCLVRFIRTRKKFPGKYSVEINTLRNTLY